MIQVGQQFSFEVTFDLPGLPVAYKIFDDSGASPVLIVGPAAMLNFEGPSYRGRFTAPLAKNYLIKKAVYTDGTFAAKDPNYAESSEAVQAVDIRNLVNSSFPIKSVVIENQIKARVSGGETILAVVQTEDVISD